MRFMRKEAERLVMASLDPKDAEVRCKEFFGKEGIRKVFKAVRAQGALPGGFEAALFGRMVTSDPEANIDAAVHVAHAITVHKAEKELDYLTVVDDLKSEEDEAGVAGIFDAELQRPLLWLCRNRRACLGLEPYSGAGKRLAA